MSDEISPGLNIRYNSQWHKSDIQWLLLYKHGQKKSIGTQGIRDNLAVLDYIHIKDCTRFSWVLLIVTY